ncbi:unnamed protein product [Diplocarpon coronariae]|nr:hypothetical protein JHW43_008761 [Diplocarpon mali]
MDTPGQSPIADPGAHPIPHTTGEQDQHTANNDRGLMVCCQCGFKTAITWIEYPPCDSCGHDQCDFCTEEHSLRHIPSTSHL